MVSGASPAPAKGADDVLAHVEQWLFSLWSERGLSDNSLAAYRSDLTRFMEWTRARGMSLNDVCRQDIVDWVSERRVKLARASVSRQLSSLRNYYGFQARKQRIPSNPTENVRAPSPQRRLPRWISEVDVAALLDAPDTSTATGLRDRAMLELMYACGLRVSELMSLDHSMLSLPQGVVRVAGKGSRDRVVPFGEEAELWLSRYLEARGRSGAQRAPLMTDAVFPGRGGRMTRQALWYRIRVYARKVGLGVEISPHTLRHAFATHLVNRGVDIRSVQLLLGHSSLSSTQIYTHVARARLQALHQQHHPRG